MIMRATEVEVSTAIILANEEQKSADFLSPLYQQE